MRVLVRALLPRSLAFLAVGCGGNRAIGVFEDTGDAVSQDAVQKQREDGKIP